MKKNGTNKDTAIFSPILTLLLGEGKSSGLFQVRVREGEKERSPPPIILEKKVDERVGTDNCCLNV